MTGPVNLYVQPISPSDRLRKEIKDLKRKVEEITTVEKLLNVNDVTSDIINGQLTSDIINIQLTSYVINRQQTSDIINIQLTSDVINR